MPDVTNRGDPAHLKQRHSLHNHTGLIASHNTLGEDLSMKRLASALVGAALTAATLVLPASTAQATIWPTGCHIGGGLGFVSAWCTGGAGLVRVKVKWTSSSKTQYGPWVKAGQSGPNPPVSKAYGPYGPKDPYWVSYDIQGD
jgi:hypothetical protein